MASKACRNISFLGTVPLFYKIYAVIKVFFTQLPWQRMRTTNKDVKPKTHFHLAAYSVCEKLSTTTTASCYGEQYINVLSLITSM